MKSTGLALLGQISKLWRKGVISDDERIEYARIIQGGMLPNHDSMYQILRNKLLEKMDYCSEEHANDLLDTLALF